MLRLKRLLSATATLLLLSSLSMAMAAPSSNLWERWAAHDAQATSTIDHTAWDKLLKRFVFSMPDGVNRFSYAHFRKPHQRQLDAYLADMSKISIGQFNRDQQRAYWINLYNALTVHVVVENFPVNSIRDISSGLFTSGPWGRNLIRVDGVKLSLDDIEHRILRPIWKDPRIHYAVNCASIGCPNLQLSAYTAENSEALLDRAAKEFINHPRGARVVGGKLQVSSIYTWFSEDFGGSDRNIISHLKEYANDELKLALNGIVEIDNHGYDWKINSVSKPENRRSKRRAGS